MPVRELNKHTGSPRRTLMELCLGLWVVHYQKEVDVCLHVLRGRVPTPGGDLEGVEAKPSSDCPGCQELPAPLSFSMVNVDKTVTVGAMFKPQAGWATYTVRLFGHDAREMAKFWMWNSDCLRLKDSS